MSLLKIVPFLFLGAAPAFAISDAESSGIKSELLELETAYQNLVKLE